MQTIRKGADIGWDKSVQFTESVGADRIWRSWTYYRSFNQFDNWSILRECSFTSSARGDYEEAVRSGLVDQLSVNYFRGESISDSCAALGEIAAILSRAPQEPTGIDSSQASGMLGLQGEWKGYSASFDWWRPSSRSPPATAAWLTGLAEIKSNFTEPVAVTELIERFDLPPACFVDFRNEELKHFGSKLIRLLEPENCSRSRY